jgi:hypothetical protein
MVNFKKMILNLIPTPLHQSLERGPGGEESVPPVYPNRATIKQKPLLTMKRASSTMVSSMMLNLASRKAQYGYKDYAHQ